MKINESCNDRHSAYITLNAKEMKKIQSGEVAYIKCVKTETEIFIAMEEE